MWTSRQVDVNISEEQTTPFSWRWRQYVVSNRLHLTTSLHGVTIHKANTDIYTAMGIHTVRKLPASFYEAVNHLNDAHHITNETYTSSTS